MHEFGGSFSAEHGIGQLKVAELERYAPPVELDLMRAIKHAFDPNGIMNPGKVLRAGVESLSETCRVPALRCVGLAGRLRATAS